MSRAGAQIRRLGPEAIREISRVLFEGAEDIVTTAQISITAGAVSGKGHVASKPGEAPNNDEGTLANNLEATQPSALRARASSNAPHSQPLEDGTSKMAARPFFQPAINEARPRIQKKLNQAMRRALAKAGR